MPDGTDIRADLPVAGRRRRYALLAIGLTVSLLACLCVLWPTIRARRAPGLMSSRDAGKGPHYVGDAACVRCHEGIARQYRAHPMGRSLAPIDQAPSELRGNTATQEAFQAQGYHYAIERRGDRTFHSEARRDAQGRVVGHVEAEVRYVLGSGTRGAAFLVEHDGYLFESPITWYPQERRWDLSPGYKEKNYHFERPIPPSCLGCHTNRVTHVAGTDNRYEPPIFHGHSIGCERCHGPGEQHVRDPLAANATGPNIINPGDVEPALREDVCQQCHLIGVNTVERPGHTLADYRPGLPLYRFETVFVRPPEAERNHQNSGHVVQMYRSRCYRESNGALGCISCHDPHSTPAAEQRVAFYRDRCLACHAERACALAPAERRRGSAEDSCIDCHAPRLPTSDIPHLATTDHTIPRTRGEPSATASADARMDETLDLGPFHEARMSPRERADAGRDLGTVLSVMGQPGAARALPLLERALATHPDDVGAWEAKGYASAALGRMRNGMAAFESALRLAPHRESTLLGTGFFADRLGRRDQAITYFQRAIALDPWRSDYFAAVALPLLESGQWQQAETAARRAIALNPANTQARVILIRCLHHARRTAPMRAEFATLLEFDPPDRAGLVRWFGTLR